MQKYGSKHENKEKLKNVSEMMKMVKKKQEIKNLLEFTRKNLENQYEKVKTINQVNIVQYNSANAKNLLKNRIFAKDENFIYTESV